MGIEGSKDFNGDENDRQNNSKETKHKFNLIKTMSRNIAFKESTRERRNIREKSEKDFQSLQKELSGKLSKFIDNRVVMPNNSEMANEAGNIVENINMLVKYLDEKNLDTMDIKSLKALFEEIKEMRELLHKMSKRQKTMKNTVKNKKEGNQSLSLQRYGNIEQEFKKYKYLRDNLKIIYTNIELEIKKRNKKPIDDALNSATNLYKEIKTFLEGHENDDSWLKTFKPYADSREFSKDFIACWKKTHMHETSNQECEALQSLEDLTRSQTALSEQFDKLKKIIEIKDNDEEFGHHAQEFVTHFQEQQNHSSPEKRQEIRKAYTVAYAKDQFASLYEKDPNSSIIEKSMEIFHNEYAQNLTTYLRTRYKGQESFENKVQEAVKQIIVESAIVLDHEIRAFLKKHENDKPWLRNLNAYTNFDACVKAFVSCLDDDQMYLQCDPTSMKEARESLENLTRSQTTLSEQFNKVQEIIKLKDNDEEFGQSIRELVQKYPNSSDQPSLEDLNKINKAYRDAFLKHRLVSQPELVLSISQEHFNNEIKKLDVLTIETYTMEKYIASGKSSHVVWSVNRDGKLLIAPKKKDKDTGIDIDHALMSQDRSLVAAGEARIFWNKYTKESYLVDINSKSSCYKTDNSCREIGKVAFEHENTPLLEDVFKSLKYHDTDWEQADSALPASSEILQPSTRPLELWAKLKGGQSNERLNDASLKLAAELAVELSPTTKDIQELFGHEGGNVSIQPDSGDRESYKAKLNCLYVPTNVPPLKVVLFIIRGMDHLKYEWTTPRDASKEETYAQDTATAIRQIEACHKLQEEMPSDMQPLGELNLHDLAKEYNTAYTEAQDPERAQDTARQRIYDLCAQRYGCEKLGPPQVDARNYRVYKKNDYHRPNSNKRKWTTVFQYKRDINYLSKKIKIRNRLKMKPAKWKGKGDSHFDETIKQGKVIWVISLGGQIIVAPATLNNEIMNHIMLTNGRPVLAAGDAQILKRGENDYILLDIDTVSGGYESQGQLANTIKTFTDQGIRLPPLD